MAFSDDQEKILKRNGYRQSSADGDIFIKDNGYSVKSSDGGSLTWNTTRNTYNGTGMSNSSFDKKSKG